MARVQRAYSMSRRSFCRASVGVLIAPRIAIAQGTTVVRRIGVLEPGEPWTSEEIQQSGDALRELGWVEGRNLQVERRFAPAQPEAFQPLAEELVRAKVEIIVTRGYAATLAAKRATTTIPIVFQGAGDPVGSGLVASLARPGGNVTGFTPATPLFAGRALSVLKELLPTLRRLGVVQGRSPYYRQTRRQFEQSCLSLGLEATFVEVDTAGDIKDAIAQLARQGAQALLLRSDAFIWDHRFEFVDAATKYRLPTMAEQPGIVREAGALVSYSIVQDEEDRRAASFIDRILRGAKPADLPVEQPTKFALTINLKTARALGLTIPKDLLLRADEVIQ